MMKGKMIVKTLLILILVLLFGANSSNATPTVPYGEGLKFQECDDVENEEVCETFKNDATWFVVLPNWNSGGPEDVTYRLYMKEGECTPPDPDDPETDPTECICDPDASITFDETEDLIATLVESGDTTHIKTQDYLSTPNNYDPDGIPVQKLHVRFCTCYYWKVVATDITGEVESPIWSFRSRGIKITSPDTDDAVVIGEGNPIEWRWCDDSVHPFKAGDSVKMQLSQQSTGGSCFEDDFEPRVFEDLDFGETTVRVNDGSYSWVPSDDYKHSDDSRLRIVVLDGDGNGKGGYPSGVFKMITTSTTTSTFPVEPIYPSCKVSITPKSVEVDSGVSMHFDATTICDDVTMTRRPYEWTIDSSDPIGSTITVISTISDYRVLYVAGENKTGKKVIETIKVEDTGYKISATATVTVNPPSVEISIAPEETTVVTEGSLQFSATTTLDGLKVEGSSYKWAIKPASTIGSSISSDGLYEAGTLTEADAVQETVEVTDTIYGISATAVVTVAPETITPGDFTITITPGSKKVASSGEVNFSAVTEASTFTAFVEPSPPDYEWSISSEIGSQINDSTGAYTAAENEEGHQVIDIITVVDHANAEATLSVEVLVTYGEITLIFPPDLPLLASRWIPTAHPRIILGENLNIDPFSTQLRFEPDDDINELTYFFLSHFGFGDFMSVTIWLVPNPVNSEFDIILDTNGEFAVANNIPLTIEMLPWNLDEKNRDKSQIE